MTFRATPTALLLTLSISAVPFTSDAQTTDGDVPGIIDTGGTSGSPAEYVIGDTADYSWDFTSTGDLAIHVGSTTDYNKLTIQNGATADFENEGARIGSAAGSDNNSVIVTGSTTTLSNGGELQIGSSGSNNSLSVLNGATVSAGTTYVGVTGTATGNTLQVNGTNSTFSTTNRLIIGHSGDGSTLIVSAGGTVNVSDYMNLGSSGGNSTITVTGANSLLDIDSYLNVGSSSGDNNTIQVLNGGTLSVFSNIDFDSTSNGSIVVDGAGSMLSSSNISLGGGSDTGNILTVSSGGIYSNTLSTFTVATGNSLRLDNGYIAWAGDNETAIASFISNSLIEVSNGLGGWVTASEDDLTYQYYNGDNTAATSFSGYSNLGYYTIIGTTSAVPEPSAFAALLGSVVLVVTSVRRPRRLTPSSK